MAGLTQQTLEVGGTPRTFLLAEPSQPSEVPGTCSGVVLSLHGTRSRASRQALLSRMEALADTASGAVVAFPQAIRPIGPGYEWDHEGDLPFLAHLTESLINRYQPAHARAIITGMSGGARMACFFAASRSDLVLAVGAVAGLRAIGDHPPTRPVPIVAFHGTADRINPYDGGTSPRWDESVRDAATRWAVANGQPGEPTEVAVSRSLTRSTWGEEGHPGEVTLWTAAGAGHTWPGSKLPLITRLWLGRTTMEIDATAKIWAFAGRHADDP